MDVRREPSYDVPTVTDAEIVTELMAASPTFAANWRLTDTHYPPSDPATLPSALYAAASHLQGLVLKDRHREFAPLLAALERAYDAATPTQREIIRRCAIETLVYECRELGLDPELFRAHLGPKCRSAWDSVPPS